MAERARAVVGRGLLGVGKASQATRGGQLGSLASYLGDRMAVSIAGREVKAVHAATGGTGLVLVGIAAEALRLYTQASGKVDVVKEAAFSKAAEAGALHEALTQCLEIVRSCAR